MSILRLSLVVFALLAGTAASVRSYLESRRPIVLEPRILVRELPDVSEPAPAPEAPWTAPAAFEAETILGRPSAETLSAAAPAREPALLVDLSTRASMASTSRWIKVRRDGLGRDCSSGAWVPLRAADGSAAGACAPSSCRPASAPSEPSVAIPPACMRPD